MAYSRKCTTSADKVIPTLVIVGNGMVGSYLCEKLVDKRVTEKYKIETFGEEPRPAYDRVRLSNYISSRSSKKLELHTPGWYEENGIELKTGVRIQEISPEEKTYLTSENETRSYDHLVFATGSSAFRPPIPGIECKNVFVYRTIEDLDAICDASTSAKSAAVLGGGLLGLEAAHALQQLNVEEIHVVELANFLMPQQLNPSASEALVNSIDTSAFTLHLSNKVSGISDKGGKLNLLLSEDDPFDVDLVIVAAGIRPRNELAKDAGLEIGGRGGIKVNEYLQTSYKDIFAIGECAEHNNIVYGLAAPGFQMADILSDYLKGSKRATFQGADTSTRLKMLGVDVLTLGDPLQPGGITTYQEDKVYRHLTLDGKGRLQGALVVGSWPEVGQVQAAVLQKKKLRKKHLNSFKEFGHIWSDSGITSPTSWPDNTVICNCIQVRKGTLCDAIDLGTKDLEKLCELTGAGSVCGSCKPLIADLAGEVVTDRKPALSSSLLLWISAIAIVVASLIMLLPPLPVAQSVTSSWYKLESIWRDFVTKQITGYSLMGLSAFGLVMSLRKRLKWFKWGDFLNWRAIHSAFGLISLFALFAHTGFRFGNNLNFWLMFVFVLLNLLGAFAGVVAALESKGTGKIAIFARRFRPALTWAHVVLFWPFPILLGFHILSVYLY